LRDASKSLRLHCHNKAPVKAGIEDTDGKGRLSTGRRSTRTRPVAVGALAVATIAVESASKIGQQNSISV
jgi:hypothetical protein